VSTQETTLEPTVLGNQRADQRLEMLGNISTVEGPVYKESQTRRRVDIVVRVSFEAHRLAPTYVATAYEHLVPLRRRTRRAATGAAPAHTDEGCGERAGA
jgi:hypothetical protein